jgi:DNA-binding SARP family transcriptional activator
MPAPSSQDAAADSSPSLAPPIDLRVLGGIAVAVHGVPVLLQPREQRLLAALAVMGPQPVHRDRLVETLFPDDDPLTGQDKLQHSITDIRLAFKKAGVPVKRAGVVRYSSGGYTLDPTLVCVDAHRFRDLLRQAETTQSTERFALLATAVEIYTGDLCGNQALDWVEGYRYAWRKEYLAALYELALHYDQEEKDPRGALRVARRLAAEEPLQDHYHQMVLELIAATGDLDALDRYNEEMRAAYARHETAVDSYTQALYERLRAQVGRAQGKPNGSATTVD